MRISTRTACYMYFAGVGTVVTVCSVLLQAMDTKEEWNPKYMVVVGGGMSVAILSSVKAFMQHQHEIYLRRNLEFLLRGF